MEHLAQLLKDLGPWAVSIVFGILARILHKASKRMNAIAATQVKADLAFEEVSSRVPEYGLRFKTWAEHR